MHFAARETLAFVRPWLPPWGRILDVGCGGGEIAAALAGAGHTVTGIDPELSARLAAAKGPNPTFVQADFRRFEASPFDVLLFVTSLHHIQPLDEVLAHARRLLRPGGLLIAEEFAVEAPDATTARWYYDLKELLAVAGRFPPERIRGAAGDEPRARWAAEHDHDLTEGRVMRQGIAASFELLSAETGPYLYRYIADGVESLGPAAGLAAHVADLERRRIADGTLRPVGLRLVARR